MSDGEEQDGFMWTQTQMDQLTDVLLSDEFYTVNTRREGDPEGPPCCEILRKFIQNVSKNYDPNAPIVEPGTVSPAIMFAIGYWTNNYTLSMFYQTQPDQWSHVGEYIYELFGRVDEVAIETRCNFFTASVIDLVKRQQWPLLRFFFKYSEKSKALVEEHNLKDQIIKDLLNIYPYYLYRFQQRFPDWFPAKLIPWSPEEQVDGENEVLRSVLSDRTHMSDIDYLIWAFEWIIPRSGQLKERESDSLSIFPTKLEQLAKQLTTQPLTPEDLSSPSSPSPDNSSKSHQQPWSQLWYEHRLNPVYHALLFNNTKLVERLIEIDHEFENSFFSAPDALYPSQSTQTASKPTSQNDVAKKNPYKLVVDSNGCKAKMGIWDIVIPGKAHGIQIIESIISAKPTARPIFKIITEHCDVSKNTIKWIVDRYPELKRRLIEEYGYDYLTASIAAGDIETVKYLRNDLGLELLIPNKDDITTKQRFDEGNDQGERKDGENKDGKGAGQDENESMLFLVIKLYRDIIKKNTIHPGPLQCLFLFPNLLQYINTYFIIDLAPLDFYVGNLMTSLVGKIIIEARKDYENSKDAPSGYQEEHLEKLNAKSNRMKTLSVLLDDFYPLGDEVVDHKSINDDGIIDKPVLNLDIIMEEFPLATLSDIDADDCDIKSSLKITEPNLHLIKYANLENNHIKHANLENNHTPTTTTHLSTSSHKTRHNYTAITGRTLLMICCDEKWFAGSGKCSYTKMTQGVDAEGDEGSGEGKKDNNPSEPEEYAEIIDKILYSYVIGLLNGTVPY